MTLSTGAVPAGAMPTGAVPAGAVPDTGAVITEALLSGGHDGAAEAVVRIRYANGADHEVVMDGERLGAVMDRLGLTSLDELRGHPWNVLVAPH